MSRELGRTICFGLFLAFFTPAVGFVAARMLVRSVQVLRIELKGVTRHAVVVRRYTRSSRDSSRYYVDLRLGMLRRPSKEVSRQFYDSVSEGQTIAIRHLPGKSRDFIILDDAGPDPPAFVALLFFAVLVFFWAVFIRECVPKAPSGRREPGRPRRARGPTHSTPDD